MAFLLFRLRNAVTRTSSEGASRNGANVAVAVHLILPGRSSGAAAAAAEAASAAAALRLRLERLRLFVTLRPCCGLPLSRLLVAAAAAPAAARLRRPWQLPSVSPRAASEPPNHFRRRSPVAAAP